MPGDLVTCIREEFSKTLLLATAIFLDPVVDDVKQHGAWHWDGDVVEVDGEVCIAVAHLCTTYEGYTPVYVIHPRGVGWVDTTEIELL